MTGPDRGEPVGGATAATGTTGNVGDIRAIAILIATGIALRLIIAYVLLPAGSGFGVDVGAFRYWADNLAQQGPFGFYDRGFFADYTPGYLYVLWLVGIVGRALGGIGDLIKLPAIIADGIMAYLVWSMVRELGGGRRAALIGAAFVLFNPVTWFDSAAWGQVDSVGTVVLLFAVRAIWRGRSIQASVLAVLAAIVKPQFGILLPILAVVLLRRHLRTHEHGERPIGLLWAALAGAATAFLLSLPFGLWPWDLLYQVVKTAAGYAYTTVNAYNPWALLSLDGNGLAATGTWVRDAAGDAGEAFLSFGPFPAVLVGTALLLVTIGGLLTIVWRRDDRRTVLVVVAVLAIAFFVVPTRVHERYLYPFFALGAILAATSVRWRVAYVVIAAASFANLYAILTLPFYENPGMADWLGIAPLIRSFAGVAVVALLHAGVFLWSLTRLPAKAVAEDDEEARRTAFSEEPAAVVARGAVVTGAAGHPARAGGAPVDATGGSGRGVPSVAAPVGGAATVAGSGAADGRLSGSTAGRWLRRVASFPTRDRSASLRSEGGGRIDRLDLLILLVIVVAALCLRTFRLAEPYRMHFDEVYHARTATEFLQFWKYGEQHDIYEYTHPHLAKYAMALGIEVAGGNDVTSTSDVGVPVSDAVIEPRWEDAAAPGGRGGDRVYLATGSDVRAYDLASRALVATIPITGARSLSMEHDTHELYIGTEGGGILAVDTISTFDSLRTLGRTNVTLPVPAEVSRLDGPVERLHVTSDGATLAAVLPGDTLVMLDSQGGGVLSRATIPGLGGIADGGTSEVLVVDPAAVTDAVALAAELQRVASLDPAEVEARLAAASGGPVIVAGRLDKALRDAVDAAIQAGSLPGVSFDQRSRLAVAADAGVVFVDPSTGATTDTVTTNGVPRDLVPVTGVGDPALYAAGDRSLWRIDLGSGSSPAPPSVVKTLAMPGDVTRVTYDTASQMVHVLGTTPDGAAQTVYVVEPNGNSVFADARLPFAPAAWAMDANKEYPATDREQLLTFAADGSSASVSVGGNAFGWRLPGVILGALVAALIYLLMRILFRRRAVAVLAGAFVLADGMMFVQSRIAMNDVYVGFFVLAAFTLFAALWTGRIRGKVGLLLALPAVGLLLGLGLASKWVALYAIGGMGILILARSALGRVLLVIGLAVITATLGYMAIAVSPTAATSGGNLFFLLLMIGITLLTVVVSVLHPVAWTLDEMRFAVVAPGVLGIGGALVAFALGITPPEPGGPTPIGAYLLAASAVLVALAVLMVVLFRVGARYGMGPLAPPPEPDDPARLLEPPAPAPEGWLRLGSGWGLPAAWMVICILVIPAAVYVVSYAPWVALGNRFTESFPAGNAGQTLVDLTRSMYDYHNNLRATHAASSPWWAWPFDLKPVWFYQDGFAGGTSGAIYDTGNLAIWWLGVVAVAFASWQAFKRRSLGLALLTVAFFVMWLPWVRIDRATFQYHYYAALVFLIPALAYFIADLWHGPSPRTWFLARVAAAVAVMGPALLWLFRMPLCAYVRVDAAYADSPACQPSVGQLVVTQRVAAIVAILFVAGLVILWQLIMLERDTRRARSGVADPSPGADRRLFAIGITAAVGAVALLATGLLSDTSTVISQDGIRPELVALLALIPLGLSAYVIVTARDPRRFVLGFVWAAVVVFVLFYPNISALPLPSQVFNAYQGILPTWLYPFQFPVNTDPAVTVKVLDWWPALLFVALLVTSTIVAYSAWAWRIALAERGADRGDERGDERPGSDGTSPAPDDAAAGPDDTSPGPEGMAAGDVV